MSVLTRAVDNVFSRDILGPGAVFTEPRYRLVLGDPIQ